MTTTPTPGRAGRAIAVTARRLAAVPAGGDLLGDLADSWSIYLESERKAKGTIRLYTGSVARFIGWHADAAPGMPVTAACLDRRTAAAFLADLLEAGAAPATARTRYAALRQFTPGSPRRAPPTPTRSWA